MADRLGITVYSCRPDEAELFRELGPRRGVVPTIVAGPVSATGAAPDRCISVGHQSVVSGPALRSLRDGGVEHISTRSIGLDHIDLDAAEALGITVENVVYAPDGVADHTLMLILMAIRDTPAVVSAVARDDFRLPAARGRDLRDLTVGVLGVGHIGTAVIRRLQGFGGRVLASSNRPTAAVGAEFVSLEVLLRESDVVTLHLPLTADTHHIIGRERIATMNPGAVIVNTGRGALVDTGALVVALEDGRIGGAALDVLEGEEGLFYLDRTTQPVDHPFLRRLQALPNVIVTPHVAYYTQRALRDTVEGTLARCLEFERRRAHGEAHDRRLVRGLFGGA